MSEFKYSIVSGHIRRPRVWLIDMDDTIYSASAGMFLQIDGAMTRFIEKHLNLPYDKADSLRMHYWVRYGVTYYGLWKHHGIDPHTFLDATHQVNTAEIRTTGDTRKAIESLPGKKILFTNAPNCFADAVLDKLHLRGLFDKEYRAEDMSVFGHWRPKPSAQMFRHLIARLGVKPNEVCLVDDSLKNLHIAKQCGMQTVLCKGWHHHGVRATRRHNIIDAQISHLRDLARVMSTPTVSATRRRGRPIFLNPKA